MQYKCNLWHYKPFNLIEALIVNKQLNKMIIITGTTIMRLMTTSALLSIVLLNNMAVIRNCNINENFNGFWMTCQLIFYLGGCEQVGHQQQL